MSKKQVAEKKKFNVHYVGGVIQLDMMGIHLYEKE